MPVCLAAIVGGNVATVTPNTLLSKKWDENNKGQQWTVEQDDNNKLAFKSEANGQYLRATTGQAYGVITTGEKQWWISSPGSSPGALWLKCADFPDAFVALAGASQGDGAKIYCWPRQQNWAHALQWYLHDAKGNGITYGSSSSSSGEDTQQAAAAKAQLEDREKAIAEREKAVDSKAEEVAKRETALSKEKGSSKDNQGALQAKEEQLTKMKGDLEQKEKEMDELKAKLKAKEAEGAQPARYVGSDTSGADAQGTEATQEVERLKKELAETKAALGRAGKSSPLSWSSSAVGSSGRKLPPIIRPAQNLPRGFDNKLSQRAIGPGGKVMTLKS